MLFSLDFETFLNNIVTTYFLNSCIFAVVKEQGPREGRG